MQSFGRSWLHRLFADGDDWRVEVGDTVLRVRTPGHSREFRIDTLGSFAVERGTIWSTIGWGTGRDQVSLAGAPVGRARSLADLVQQRVRAAADLERLKADTANWFPVITGWAQAVDAEWRAFEHRWIPLDVLARWTRDRPGVPESFLAGYDSPRLADFIESQPAQLRDAVEMWRSDLAASIAGWNEAVLESEPYRQSGFFASVEKTPLTAEQIRAVVCFDNRVRVIAAAGSGKTSTMVARAGYAINNSIVPAGRILMLAFNKKAAAELADRVAARLGTAGRPVNATTFHAFGLSVIGQATGRKPSIGRGLDDGDGVDRLFAAVDALRDRDPVFRTRWDLFRLVFGRELPAFDSDDPAEDVDGRKTGFRTLNGELVKSQEERMLANWLFYNGVRYEYERPYVHPVADADHVQYRPDFYYPDVDVWHEHFALNAQGRPPPRFKDGYLNQVAWKRRTHREHKTVLWETTSASVRDGSAFTLLAGWLTKRGVDLDENPYREVVGKEPVPDREVVRLFRTFLTHAKSNRLELPDLSARASGTGASPMRVELFLSLYGQVREEWDAQLRAEQAVDFDDMLLQAADLIGAGRWDSPYRLIMVDEMQDTSPARARLVAALVDRPDRYLFAVGDDWQSINRFAGSDPAVMADFDRWFGAAVTVRLETTFRCPQSICDIAGGFVTKNSTQLPKTVRSTQTEHPPTVRAVSLPTAADYLPAITDHLTGLDASSGRGTTVMILGRYRRISELVRPLSAHRFANLTVSARTIHAAKGAEADHVIVPGLTVGGLPSAVDDDPLLELAQPAREGYPFAEERRLFYVALTRARRSVLLLAVDGRESPFLLELAADKVLALTTPAGGAIPVVICPGCGTHRMEVREGPYGTFYGCKAYPRCRRTINIKRK